MPDEEEEADHRILGGWRAEAEAEAGGFEDEKGELFPEKG
jgi:hypothetical protein